MAITKILFIQVRLGDRVSYVTNEKKTTLGGMIEYAVSGDKTEQRLYEAALNCASPETAYREMTATKERWGKTGGVLGYHIIQSFSTGETTPDEAHEIGIELTRRLFGDRFEAVIGTHLNTDNLHNHIVINSVSFKDGSKYRSTKANMYRIREVSDAICKEHSLSVILSPQERGKHYAEWKAENEGKPTARSPIRDDIDRAISQSLAPSQFYAVMRKMGYELKPNVKYPAVRPPGSDRFFRLKSLGINYTPEAIQSRILGQTSVKISEKKVRSPAGQKAQKMQYHFKGAFPPRKKMTGFRALYFHYLYKMGILPRNCAPAKRVHFLLREDLRKLDQITAETKFLCTYHIDTKEQLLKHQSSAEAGIAALADERKHLRYRARSIKGEAQLAECKDKITEISKKLSKLRKEVRYCTGILSRSELITDTLSKVRQDEIKEKELKQHEHQRGRGGPGR